MAPVKVAAVQFTVTNDRDLNLRRMIEIVDEYIAGKRAPGCPAEKAADD